MQLARKLRKVFHLDSIHSGYEHLRRLSRPVDRAAMLAQLDRPAWEALHRRYRTAPPPPGQGGSRDSFKFADLEYWLRVNVERAQDLDLDRARPLRILDFGCGAGYFLFVAQCLGHEVWGVDLDENPLYRETVQMLGVKRHVGRIDPLTPVPAPGGRFDLITAHCICFQKIRPLADERWVQWGVDEWAFFLDDVRSRLLLPGGRLLLDFNPRRGEAFYAPEVAALFRAAGGRLFRSKVLFPAAGATADQRHPKPLTTAAA